MRGKDTLTRDRVVGPEEASEHRLPEGYKVVPPQADKPDEVDDVESATLGVSSTSVDMAHLQPAERGRYERMNSDFDS